MNFEDVNSLYEKYKYLSFWYSISYDDIVLNIDNHVDFCEITGDIEDTVYCEVYNTFFTQTIHIFGEKTSNNNITLVIKDSRGAVHDEQTVYEGQIVALYIYVDKEYLAAGAISDVSFVPLTPLTFLRTQSETYGQKIYIEKIWDGLTSINVGTLHYEGDLWVIDTVNRTIQEDEDGFYVNTYFNDNLLDEIFLIYGGGVYYFGKIIIAPNLPVITYAPLYKDGKQHIQLYFDGNIIDDKYYSVIYKNELLKDNIIDISEDTDQVDIKINLNHPDYIKTVLNYSITVDYFIVSSMSDINIAKQKGLRTVVNDAGSLGWESLSLSNIKLISNTPLLTENLVCENAIIFSDRIRSNNIHLKDSELQVGIITQLTSNFTNITCISSNINNTRVINCKIKAYDTCIFENNEFYHCLIISDSDNMSIMNNNFYSVFEYADYFPNSLYLTGNFKCQGNTFNQEETFTELDFNVALLKTIPDTDITQFIQQNTFNLTNTVENTEYTGLFYNLIDEDDLKYREVE